MDGLGEGKTLGPDSTARALRRSVREPEAFVDFYDAHALSLLRFFTRRTLEPETALDLTAETFAQAYISRHRFRGDSDSAAAAWLYKIAARQLSHLWRRGRLEKKALQKLAIELAPLDPVQEAQINTLSETEDMRELVRLEMRRLAAGQQEALLLRVVQELPYEEVARRLNITEEAARARVSRGLRSLRMRLQAHSLASSGKATNGVA